MAVVAVVEMIVGTTGVMTDEIAAETTDGILVVEATALIAAEETVVDAQVTAETHEMIVGAVGEMVEETDRS